MMEQMVSGACRLSCAFHAAGNSPPGVRRGDNNNNNNNKSIYIAPNQSRLLSGALQNMAN